MITLVGLIEVAAIVYFLGNLNKFFNFFVVTTAFSAASLVVLPNSTFGIIPAYLTGAILIILVFYNALIKRTGSIIYTLDALIPFIFFICLSSISLFYPIVLEVMGISVPVFNVAFNDQSIIEIGRLTQISYFWFLCLVAISISIYVNSKDKLYSLVRVFIYASTFTVFWGLGVQGGSFLFGFDYPDYIFNNHPGYAQGFDQEIFGYVKRMCSVAQEPSVYAYYLMYTISILSYLTLKKIKIVHHKFQTPILILHILMLLLTTSSTGFVAFCFMILLLLLFNLNTLNTLVIDKMFFYIFFILLILLVVFYVFMSYFLQKFLGVNILELLELLTLNKLESGSSGDVRLGLFYSGLDVLYSSNFIGAGFGVNRTVDINTTLLSNIGIIGFISFIFAMFYPVVLTINKLNLSSDNFEKTVVRSVLFAHVISYFVMSIAIPDFVNVYYWLIWGVVMALPNILVSGKFEYYEK